jgi:hypothetical protein
MPLIEEGLASNRAGLWTSKHAHWAREIATFSRFLLKRESIFRGISSPLEVAMEIMTTSASWPMKDCFQKKNRVRY